YQRATGYQPFFKRVYEGGVAKLVSETGGPVFPATVPRLALQAVKAAIRNHYLGSSFGDKECPDGMDPIVFFFNENKADRQFADFPKGRFAPGYVFLSEADLVHILHSNDETKAILAKVMGDATAKAAEDHVIRTKGSLIKKLLYNTAETKRFDGYHKKVRLQSDSNRAGKFKLRGTICTNGLVVNLLAYDETALRRRQQIPQPASGVQVQQSPIVSSAQGPTATLQQPQTATPQQGPGDDDEDIDDSDLFDVQNQIEGGFLLDDAFIPGAEGLVQEAQS
ncbi:hypothetical protein BGX28_001776, partial [Mortierella sp. GBA30]